MKDQHFYILLGLGAFAVWSVAVSAKKAAADLGASINPANTDNIFYNGVNAIGDTLDNGLADESFTLGGWVWDILHPEWKDGIPEGK